MKKVILPILIPVDYNKKKQQKISIKNKRNDRIQAYTCTFKWIVIPSDI